MADIIGFIFITLGIIFMIFGCIGLIRFRDFYSRILVTSLIDTCGFITMMVGIMIYSGLNFFTLKVGLILLTVLLLNPVSTHFITKSAHYSGYHVKRSVK